MNDEGIATSDRLSVTLVFALLCHAVVVLGITFDYEEPGKQENLPSLDVILVRQRNEEAPKEADYLAQAAQVGGGNVAEKARPQAPVASDIPKPERGLAPQPVLPSNPTPNPRTPPEVLTSERAVAKVVQQRPQPPTPDTLETPSQELLRRSLELTRLEAEIGRDLQAYAKRPRRKFISANTREYAYASYMQAWVAKVERIGNLNYPDEARRHSLEGNLVLTVAINRDGRIDSIDIIQPSGFSVLDQAAIRIVELGTPYAPLPEDIRDRIDILHITRTWQFLPGNVLRHK